MINNSDQTGTFSEVQRKIISEPAKTKMLVLSGPGTGKTHTLIHRLVNLVMIQGLEPFSEILVLSFSRAAVSEIRNRIGVMVIDGAPDDMRFINVRTFDSFATRFLAACDEEIDLSKLDYDTRIKLAIEKITDLPPNASEILESFRHIIVDEIQDLVGVRARMVQKILEHVGGGFTLLGDPAQGIFDYLVSQSGIGPTSEGLISWVRSQWQDDLIEYSLNHNYRVKSASAEVAKEARSLVLGSQENGSEALLALTTIVNSLDSVGSIESPDTEKIITPDKQTAILCRTNSDVLFVSSQFMQKGIPCVIPPHSDEKGLPPWVGRIFYSYSQKKISRPVFEDRWNKLIGDTYSKKQATAWDLLKSTEGRESSDLDLEILRSRFRHGVDWVFDSESQWHHENILVSTVHQSKGREYDRVFILPPVTRGRQDKSSILEESRILYVAATRAKESIMRLDRKGFRGCTSNLFPSDKNRYLAQRQDGTHMFEIMPDDVEPLAYVNNSIFPKAQQALAIQELIWNRLKPGTPITLIPQKSGNDFRIILAWINPGSGKPLPIGCLNDDLSEDLGHYLGNLPNNKKARYAPLLEGAVVFERHTIVLPPYEKNIHSPWADSCFCLGLGIKGFIDVD